MWRSSARSAPRRRQAGPLERPEKKGTAPLPHGHSPLFLRPLLAGQDMHDVAVVDEVGLPLQPVDAVGLRLLHGTDTSKVRVGDDLGPHETLGQVGVDLRGSLYGICSLAQP